VLVSQSRSATTVLRRFPLSTGWQHRALCEPKTVVLETRPRIAAFEGPCPRSLFGTSYRDICASRNLAILPRMRFDRENLFRAITSLLLPLFQQFAPLRHLTFCAIRLRKTPAPPSESNFRVRGNFNDSSSVLRRASDSHLFRKSRYISRLILATSSYSFKMLG
jgi:hypothetical protein